MTHESENELSGTHPESQMLNEAGLQAAAEAIAEYLGSDEPTSIARTAIRAYLSAIHSQGAAAPSEEPVAQLGAGSEHDLHNIMKSVLYHFGPEGAAKVTRDALGARPGVLK